MKKLGLLVLLLAAWLASCDGWQEKKLLGKWKAAEATEDGMPMPLPLEVVGFEFFPNGKYLYTGTIGDRESGDFSVSGGLLYTMDTLNEASSEKAVKIMLLTQDSLFLKMNKEGKEQQVKLFRVK